MEPKFRSISILALILLLLSTAAAAASDKADEETRWIARTTSQNDKASFQLKGCKIIHELNDATAVKCPKGILIENAFEDQIYTVMDLDADKQINADDVWALGYTGSGVTVAILDTGIDTDNPELTDSIVGGRGFGYATYEDDHGHGTHVAGIITANGAGGTGYAKGVAPAAGVWMGKVCNKQGTCYTSDIAAGIEYVVNNPAQIGQAKIISISIGGGGTSQANCDGDYLAQKVNWAVDSGVTVVVAAGNTAGVVSSPGCASKAIAVGAVDKSDVRASFSGTGYALDIMAPGVSIYSSLPGNTYAYWSGTSMATPHVSATVALLRQANSALTDSQIKNALYNTAKDLGNFGWDTSYGWGRVDALAAVQSVTQPPPAPVHDVAVTSIQAPGSVTRGDTAVVLVTVVNEGTVAETFDVILTDVTYNAVIGSVSVSLNAGSSTVLTFNWDTAAASTGNHELKAQASAVPGETDTADNSRTAIVEVRATAPKMHIASIDMALFKNARNTYAKATVTIVDENRNPVAGATVSGQWSGATSDSDIGVTDASGKVTLRSDNVRKPPAGTTFTFTVNNVAKIYWVYDPGANVETSDSIAVP